MKNLEVLTPETASDSSRELFAAIKGKIGMLPNVYATIGHSAPALKATLGIQDALSNGAFSDKEREVVALAVAQANECEYCLAAHTAVGKGLGLSQEDTVAIRTGEVNDTRLRALSVLAYAITASRGYPGQEKIDAFFNAGFSRAALSELIVLVAMNTITNYTNHIAGTPIDFPAAPALASV